MVDNQALSRKLLEATLVHDRSVFSSFPQSINPLAAKFAGEAALLLGFTDLVESFRAAAQRVPRHAGRLDGKMWEAFTTIRKLDEVAVDYPVVDEQSKDMLIETYPRNDFIAAFHRAQSEYEKECVLITQVVHQQVESAIDRSRSLSPSHMWNVRFIAAMESYRVGDLETGKRLHATFPNDLLCEWGKPQMALVISGRAGWGGYPYLDY